MDLERAYTVLKSPLITEKAGRFTPLNKYSFYVDLKANKIEIKQAIEKIYNVKVEKVNTLIIKGKTKRFRYREAGKTSDYKKAIVTLKKGYEIKLA